MAEEPPPVGAVARKWAEMAEQLELGQLERARKRAESWRTGLTGLTALLATVTIIKGPDAAADLSPERRTDVVGLLTVAFVLLVLGSLLAMWASFGWQHRDQHLPPVRLRALHRRQVAQVRVVLIVAVASFVGGLLFVGVATRVVLLDTGPGAEETFVHVVAADGAQPPGIDEGERFCAELLEGTAGVLTVDPADATDDDEPLVLRFDQIVRLEPASSC